MNQFHSPRGAMRPAAPPDRSRPSQTRPPRSPREMGFWGAWVLAVVPSFAFVPLPFNGRPVGVGGGN